MIAAFTVFIFISYTVMMVLMSYKSEENIQLLFYSLSYFGTTLVWRLAISHETKRIKSLAPLVCGEKSKK